MLIGAEIGLFVYGIYVLITGKYSLGRRGFVYGTPARILGVLCLLPLPVAFGLGLIVGTLMALGIVEDITMLSLILEGGVLLIVIVLISVLSKRFYRQQQVPTMS